jgi:glutamyl/glutaminyl-tRNA synthetase
MAKKANTAYDGRCRHLTDEEVKRKKQAGKSYVVRFKVGFESVWCNPAVNMPRLIYVLPADIT